MKGLRVMVAALLLTLATGGAGAADSTRQEHVVRIPESTDLRVSVVEYARYPRNAVVQRVESWVKVHFDVDEQGRASNVRLYDAPLDEPFGKQFGRSAVRSVRSWEFHPATVAGSPVVRNASQLIRFTLKSPRRMPAADFERAARQVEEALAQHDLVVAKAALDALEELRNERITEHAWEALLLAEYWRAAGNDHLARAHVDRAIELVEEAGPRSMYARALRHAMPLAARRNDFNVALASYEKLLAADESIEENDPVHELAKQVRERLAAPDSIVTQATIERCALCLDESAFYSRRLNRLRFYIDADPGQVSEVIVSCGAARERRPWSDAVMWRIVSPPASECSVIVHGETGARLTLVELPGAFEAGDAPEEAQSVAARRLSSSITKR